MKKSLLLAFLSVLFLIRLSAQAPPVCPTAAVNPADDCANACLSCNINGYHGTTSGFSAGDAPLLCGAADNEQWIGFVAASSTSSITLSPSNCANNQGLEVAVYQQCGDAPLACAVGLTGSSPVSVNFPTTAGSSYFLVVDGIDGDECDFSIFATNTMPPPLGSTGALQGPASVAPFGMATYSVAPVSGAGFYTWNGPPGIKINGQNPPVQLAAPGGNQVTVTFNGNGGGLCVTPRNACTQGTMACKDIALFSPLGPVCPTNSEPPADNCGMVCTFCNFNGLSGTTVGYTGGLANGFCGTIENEQWMSFVAGASSLSIAMTASNCLIGNGVQMALYESCDGMPLPGACGAGCPGCADTPVSITATVNPGQQYFLLVDGYAGDECDFSVSLLPPTGGTPPVLGPTGDIQGPSGTCPGGTVNYSVPPVSGAGAYIWSAPAGSTINGQDSPLILEGPGSNSVEISFGAVGGQVCVQPANACNTGASVCKNITLTPIPPTVLPPVTVCNEDLPYTLPWGIDVSVSGVYEYTLTAVTGCDSVVRQQVTVKPPISTSLPPRAVCAGESFTVCGTTFTETGTYTEVCTSYEGCDSTINFSLFVLEDVKIVGGLLLSCTSPAVVLAGSVPGTRVWTDENGTVLGNGNSLTVSTPGIYILTNTQTMSGVFCVSADTVEVEENTVPPTATAAGGALSCAQLTIQLDGGTDTPGAAFLWTGPDNFTSSLQDPIVDVAGDYTLVVGNPVNGCTASATTSVTGTPIVLLANISGGGQLDCADTTLILSGSTNAANPVFNWTGPAGFTSSLQNPEISEPGIYTLTVVEQTAGCQVSDSITVTQNIQAPVLAYADDTLNCLVQTLIISGSAAAGDPVFQWSGPGNFTSSVQNPAISLPGTYSLLVTDQANACTSTENVEIAADVTPPDLTAGGDTLTCTNPLVMLSSMSSTASVFEWSGPGNFTSGEQNPLVSQPGTYTVTVTGPNGCVSALAVEVVLTDQVPSVQLNVAPLTCASPTQTVETSTDAMSPSFNWTGPGAFNSTLQTPAVSVAGVYSVTITDGVSGCMSIGTVSLAADMTPPDVSATVGGILTCAVTSVLLDGSSTTPGVTLVWLGSPFPDEDVTVEATGVYSLQATATNGCTSLVEVVVAADTEPPVITPVEVTDDQDMQGVGAIDIAIAGGVSPFQIQWFLNGQAFDTTEDLNSLHAGQYMAVVTGANSCTDTIVQTVGNVIATNEPFAASLWSVFPNPANGFLQIQYLGTDKQDARFLLLDATGRMILENNVQDASMTMLEVKRVPPGAYKLLIRTKTGVWVKIITIQR